MNCSSSAVFSRTIAPRNRYDESGVLYTPTTHYIEDAALGPAAGQLLGIPGVEMVPVASRSKEERLDDVLPVIATSRVYIPDERDPAYEWVRGWLDRVTQFPSSVPDDEVDVMSMALQQLATNPAAALIRIYGGQT